MTFDHDVMMDLPMPQFYTMLFDITEIQKQVRRLREDMKKWGFDSRNPLKSDSFTIPKLIQFEADLEYIREEMTNIEKERKNEDPIRIVKVAVAHDYAGAHITHKGLHEPTESTIPALDRCKEAGFVQCADGTCTCHGCRYSRTAEYADGETKFVCDKLNIQTYKCAWCKYFKLKRRSG